MVVIVCFHANFNMWVLARQLKDLNSFLEMRLTFCFHSVTHMHARLHTHHTQSVRETMCL